MMLPVGGYGLGADTSTVQALVISTAQKYGLDPNLALAVARQESAFNPSAISRAGAQGVMQLMPATAASLGVSNPLDPTQNIDGGVRLLSQLLQQYNGDTSLALAAYNAGSPAVSKYGGIPPYAETQNYVSKILANYDPSASSPASVPDPQSDPSGSTGDPVTPTSDASFAGLPTWGWVAIGAVGLALLMRR
jgi:soluble lytic murein transglycosylase-like protein